jgi:hypothetical protein
MNNNIQEQLVSFEATKEYWFEQFKNNYLNPKNVTRIEIINHNSSSENYGIGRVFTHYDVKSCELSFQDDYKTLKIFI